MICLWILIETMVKSGYGVKVENISKGNLDSIPSPFTFSENSNYRQESLLEVYMQNIVGRFENKKLVDITQQCFALLPQVSFPANNLNFQ